MNASRAVILDRDGTLIDLVRDEESGTIATAFHPNQVRLLPKVVEGLTLLRDAGYVFAIATNQPGPAKGQWSRGAVERTNAAVVSALAEHGLTIVDVASCMHHPAGGPGGDASLVGPCACRKPLPGLIEELLSRHGFDREQAWMVGDSAGDVQAGQAARVRTGLVFASNRCELCPLRGGPAGLAPSVSGPDLLAIAQKIVAFGVAV